MKRDRIFSPINVTALCLSAMAVFSLVLAIPAAQAQTGAKAAGELTAARQTVVNGTAARSSGATVFSNSRIKTGDGGSATVSLGKRGRVELGAKTDLTLQFGNGSLGGNLHAGRLVLSVPAGVSLALNTVKGLVKTDGLQPAVVSIEAANEKMKVIAHLGEAKIVFGGKTEVVTPGEEVAIGSQVGAGWQHRRMVAAGLVGVGSAVGAASAGQALGPAALKPAASLTSLLNTGINFSIAQIVRAGGDPERFFDTTIVCRDTDNFLCRRRSGVSP